MKKEVYIEVKAGVRYWEDGSINGNEDNAGNMPLRDGDCWCPTIRLEDGLVMNWPEKTSAKIHYKVCDAGDYWLVDANGWKLSKWSGHYVPDKFLAQDGSGFGDYIILEITEDGKVKNWKVPSVNDNEWSLIG